MAAIPDHRQPNHTIHSLRDAIFVSFLIVESILLNLIYLIRLLIIECL